MKYSPSIHNIHIFTHRNVDDDLLAGLGGEPPQTGSLGLRRGRRDVPGRAPLRAPARRAAVALLDLDDVVRTQPRVPDLRTICNIEYICLSVIMLLHPWLLRDVPWWVEETPRA